MKILDKIKDKLGLSKNKEAEALAFKLGLSSEEIKSDYVRRAAERMGDKAIFENGKINLSKYHIASSTNLGYMRKPNYRQRTGYTGCDNLILVNDKINESISELYYSDNILKLTTPIMSCCDNEHAALSSMYNETITELLINEYDQIVVRHFKNVTYISEHCIHNIDQVSLSNTYIFECKQKPTSFATLSDAEFLEQYGKIIKKIGTGEYISKS